jgi:hypothetical protein
VATAAPPQAEKLAARYNSAQLTHAQQVASAVAGLWQQVSLADLDGSFQAIAAALIAQLVRGQLLGAGTATAYNLSLLGAYGLRPSGPVLNPRGFADPERVARVVGFAPIRTKQRIATGMTPDEALASGSHELTMIAETETQESARGVLDVSLNTEPQYRGYLRHPNPGACARCLILANKFYRSNEGFLRHPRCHCTHIPIPVGSDLINLPTAAERFHGLSPKQQDRIFTKDGAEAIRAGADVSSVVNARSGMRNAGDGFTKEGLTVRSVSGKRLEAAGQKAAKRKGERYRRVDQRLSPLGCRRIAAGDQEQYHELLRLNGYII